MRADSAETLEELLDVAEKLFAERGIENVPLTQIVAKSGQKNRSALHYYFGSREGLVAAVLDRRLQTVNELRGAYLDDAMAQKNKLAAIVRAAVKSLGDVVFEERWGAHYISVLAQVVFHPKLLGERDVDRENLSELRRSEDLVAIVLPSIKPSVLARRLQWVSDNCVVAFARWIRDTPPSRRTRAGMDDEIEQLVAYGAAALAAPAPTDRGA